MEATDLQLARDLAEAMRVGQEARHLAPASADPFALAPEADDAAYRALARLTAQANLLGHSAVVRPGRFARPVRFLRQVLKAFLQPWLDFQTLFNRALIDHVEALRAETRALLRRQETGLWCQMEQFYDSTVNRELGPGGQIARGGLWFRPAVAVGLHNGRPEVVAVTERIVERFFVHTRLPPPPARVLVLDCAADAGVLELASVGYHVTGVDPNPPPLEHPALTLLRARTTPLPLPAGSFDAVVCLAAAADSADREAVAEAGRVLRAGGRLLLSLPCGRPSTDPGPRIHDRAGLDALLDPLRGVEVLFGVRHGQTWSVAADAPDAGPDSAVALVVAEKPGCTC
jgi:SAM-dependent methyltransferase